MPDNVSDPTDLKTQYAAQVAADLENNTKEQERIGSDIATLQRQLEELERNHALLQTMQRALTEPTAPPGATPQKARLPRARRPKDATPERAARTARGTKRTAQERPVKTSGKGRGSRRRADGPTLREVVSGLLADHSEPRSAAEVTTALAQSHPERKISPTVVRNTLEALVAKGQAHRTKQQKSVFYTAVDTAPAGADGQADPGAGEQQGEAAGA